MLNQRRPITDQWLLEASRGRDTVTASHDLPAGTEGNREIISAAVAASYKIIAYIFIDLFI